MAEMDEFSEKLKASLNAKQNWMNNDLLPKALNNYRLLHTCVKNIYDLLVKKSLIVPDPYRLDKRISDIVVPDSTPFPENDVPTVLGSRFSDYELMLDFICTYYRFSVENLQINKIRKLQEFNACFEWDNLTANNARMNTRTLATTLNSARNNAAGVIISMINDSINKSSAAITEINKIFVELASFQREFYKGELRKNIFEHPQFDKAQAMISQDSEMNEIKKNFTKVMGKKPFYNDLVTEIILEDQGEDREQRRAAVLRRLEIADEPHQERKKTVLDPKAMLIDTALTLGGLAPTIHQIRLKVEDDFDLVFAKKKNFFTLLGDALKKLFHISPKPKICEVSIQDAKTGTSRKEKVIVKDFLEDLNLKERIYNGIGTRGPEFSKIQTSSEEAVLMFVNKQISESQSMFTILNALDVFFKNSVDIVSRPKVKGLQIELSALRNSIINVNKKRGEYISVKEEAEQMKKLGIKNEN